MRYIKNIFKKISFGNKIFIFNALVFIISLSVLAFSANQISTNTILDKAQRSSIRELKLIDRNISTMKQSIEDYLRLISSEYRLQNTLYSINSNRENNIKENPLEKTKISSLMSSIVSNIISPSTHLIGSSILIDDEVLYSGYDLSNFDTYDTLGADYFKEVKQTQKPVWSGIFPLEYDSGRIENVFAVAKIIIDKETGEDIGTAVVFVDEKEISNIYLESRSNEDVRFYIIDSNNMIISSGKKSDLYNKAEPVLGISGDEYSELIDSGSFSNRVEKTQYLYSISSFSDLNWNIVSTTPLDEIIKESGDITKILLAITILCLLMAFGLSFIISNRIVNPIRTLTRITKQIIKGNMGVRAKINVGGEVGILANGFNELMDRIEKLIKEVYDKHQKQRETEFKLIQAQINPHFLYNTLEMINSFIALGMTENAERTVKDISRFYRICLSKGDDVISIGNEVKIIRSYLSIQKLRYTEFMDFKLDISNDILKYGIPKLTLQPIIENSIYHGLKNKNEKGRLIIKGMMEKKNIVLEVFDDGIGMTKEMISSALNHGNRNGNHRTSYGLCNISSRLKLLYGNSGRLKIESVIGKYTKVIIRIPPILL
jgi:two-component system sensor histidine kinase YesM